ncbi:MAG: hypothetical protein A2096_07080 [Spirochaetes bacterium GWF1_41_5]|nr:MAG: hypothetical protein A2096_07080 [Spirochaetes bacterium GWF1_41_5]HBE02858.1 hypothetical protein [Spirochaetia bacterium]
MTRSHEENTTIISRQDKCLVLSCAVLWREVSYFAALSSQVYDLKFIDQNLHNQPAELKKYLQTEINNAGGYQAVMLCYGLCSNAVDGLTAGKRPLVLFAVHDCISFFLGSAGRYREIYDKNPGIYWYTPGWIDHTLMPGKQRYDYLLADYREKYGEDNALYLMETEQNWFKKYGTAAYIDLGFLQADRYREFTRKCANWLGWKFCEYQGDASLFRNFFNQEWKSRDIMVINPGEAVRASYNNNILCSCLEAK